MKSEDLQGIRDRQSRLKRILLLLFAIGFVGFPFYTLLFISRLETAHKNLATLKKKADDLTLDIGNKEKQIAALSVERAGLEKTLQASRDSLALATRHLQDAQESYEDFKSGIIDKATFLNSGLGMYTATDRFSDWRKRIGAYTERGQWNDALQIADLIESSHEKDPSAGDVPSLIAATRVWRTVAALSKLEQSAIKNLPSDSPSLVLRRKAAKAYDSVITLMKSSGKEAPDYVYGNAGINLIDIAMDGTLSEAKKLETLRDAEILLRTAVSAVPTSEAWLQRLIQVTEKLKRNDPAALFDFCSTLSLSELARIRCGHAISQSAHRSYRQGTLNLESYEFYVCGAAKLAVSESAIMQECRNLRQRIASRELKGG